MADLVVRSRLASVIAAVALLLQMVALAPPAAASVAEDSDYRFGDTFNSAVGTPPALVALERPASETGDFATETVDGAARRVFAFGTGQGLELSPTTGLVGNEYTIAMVVRQSEVSGYRKLIDFWGGTTDDGLYVDDGTLHFYGLGMGSSAVVDADEWVHIVLTRTAAGTLTGYVDGEQQFTSDDVSALAVPNGASALRFFVEDGATATEESAGAIARLRTWSTALSAGDVAALAQLPDDVVVPTDHTLTVEIAGDGAGSVTRSDEGTACDPDTSACRTYPAGTDVTLTATPEAGSTFFGWGMAVPEVCSTEPYPTECTVTVDGDKTVQAVFLAAADPTLTVVVEGPGTVASAPAGITDCADECSAPYAPGTEVTLTATPDGSATFNGWTVAHDATACAGTGTCTVTMDAARTVTASFAAADADTDGDGVLDNDDACVNVRGSGADGCPVDRTIDTNSPIDAIMVTRDLNCASTFNGNRMFFADLACGTFLAVDGTSLFGPASVPAGPSAQTAWTPWRQEPVTGTGTAQDPYTVVTEVAAGTTGIHLIQTDTYVEGASEIATSMQVVNTGDTPHDVVLYRAADCYFQGSDAGFGNFVAETEAIGCREVVSGAPGDLVLEWEPGNAADSDYYESSYGSVWGAVEGMTAFPNACAQCPNQVDNGAGLSWSATLAAGGADGDEATRSHVLRVVERDVTAGEIPGDADVDGVPDADDLCPNTPEDPNDPDDPVRDGCPGQDDGDGIDPSFDNCPATYNLTQDDWDEDGIGDACDVVASIEDHDSGAEGSTLDNGFEVSVPVTLEEPAIGDVTLTFATISGTAVADADFVPTATGTVTILDGDITGYATVKLIGDLAEEGDETFSIVLTNPDMEYTDDSGEVTITDDESSCDLDGDGILHVYGGYLEDLDIRRSGDDIVVSGTSINQVCGLMSAVDTIVVHGFDHGDSYPTTDVVISAADGTFTPGATAEASGLSELEIEVEHVNLLEFVGTPGNDDIRVGTTGLALNSDSDADILTTGVSAVVVSGGEGADRIYATGGRGSGSTCTARVVFNGGPGADRLIGGGGLDDLYGGDGNDTMIGGAGADWMFGNDGVDTVSYADHHYENVSVNLADGVANDGTVDGSGNSTEMDKAEAENAIGGAGNDKLFGTDGPNKLTGGYGTDDLYGYDGNDSMTAGPGGGLLYAGGGKDRVIGGSGDDDLWGHAGDDLLYGYGGNDELHPGAGIDFVSGGADFDEVMYLYDATDATGGVGIDVGMGVGTAGIADDDVYVGLESYRGTIYSDTLIGGPDADRLHAIGGDDTLTGGGGNDVLYAGDGNDNLHGDAGFDDMYGEAGDDTFFEGSESNGSDDFIGDAGSDQVVYSYRTSPTVHTGVTDGSIQINGVVVTVDSSFNDGAPLENDRVRTDIEKVWGTQFNDKMVGQNAKDILYGQAGQDVLEGSGGHDYLYGEDDGDTLRGGSGSDVLSAGSGNDDLYGDAGNDDLYGHDGNDFFGEGSSPNGSDDFIGGPGADGVDYGSRPSTHQLRLSLDNNSFDDGAYTTAGEALENDNLRTSIENVQAGAGGDLLWGNGAANKMWGGAGADQLFGYAGMDQLDGGDGVDSIWGGNHDDTLWGGNQKDYLYGEAGYDTIFGGGGSDQCIGEALDSCP